MQNGGGGAGGRGRGGRVAVAGESNFATASLARRRGGKGGSPVDDIKRRKMTKGQKLFSGNGLNMAKFRRRATS